MLYEAIFPLTFSEPIPIRPDMGSIFQGALMEIIDNDDARTLHAMQLRPYTQSVMYDHARRKGVWRITTLNPYGYSAVLEKILAYDKPLYLRQRQVAVSLGTPVIRQTTYEALGDAIFQAPQGPRIVNVTMRTATTFKHDNMYDILPSMERCYGSLLAKWNTFSTTSTLEQAGLAADLSQYCRLVKYHLDSQVFGLEGIRINGFVGTMRLRFSGNDMVRRLQGLLWAFAPYSGLGIKTAMGMGAVEVAD